MRKITFLLILIIASSCTEKERAPSEQITAYYEGFNHGDYSQIRTTISDSLLSIEGDYMMPYSRESFNEKFKWDSIFKPVYKLVSVKNQGDQALVTVTMSSAKHEFLKNSPMTCNYTFHFKAGKIYKIENLECPDAKWEIWGQEVSSLVNWVKAKHPELDGFINDLTMKGAQDYMKAIALYKNRSEPDDADL